MVECLKNLSSNLVYKFVRIGALICCMLMVCVNYKIVKSIYVKLVFSIFKGETVSFLHSPTKITKKNESEEGYNYILKVILYIQNAGNIIF